jgi:hypothetical protein
MKKYIPVLLTILGVGLVIGLVNSVTGHKLQPRFEIEGGGAGPSPQPGKKRTWKSTPQEKLGVIGSEADGTFDNAWSAKVDAEGNLYVLDVGSLQVKKFDPAGSRVRVFGKGRGQGPGEFSSITDYRVTAEGHLWVTDLSSSRLTQFGDDGEVLRTVPLKRTVYRVVSAKPDRMTVMFSATDNILFGHVRLRGQEMSVDKEFGRILADQRRHALALDGSVSADEKGGLIYVPWYFGAIAAYSPQGDLRYFVETIDRVPLPRILKTGDVIHVDREGEESAKDASLVGDTVFVFKTVRDGAIKGGAVDAYSYADGRYLYTVGSPALAMNVLVTRDSLYTVMPTAVTRWKRNF